MSQMNPKFNHRTSDWHPKQVIRKPVIIDNCVPDALCVFYGVFKRGFKVRKWVGILALIIVLAVTLVRV